MIKLGLMVCILRQAPYVMVTVASGGFNQCFHSTKLDNSSIPLKKKKKKPALSQGDEMMPSSASQKHQHHTFNKNYSSFLFQRLFKARTLSSTTIQPTEYKKTPPISRDNIIGQWQNDFNRKNAIHISPPNTHLLLWTAHKCLEALDKCQATLSIS